MIPPAPSTSTASSAACSARFTSPGFAFNPALESVTTATPLLASSAVFLACFISSRFAFIPALGSAAPLVAAFSEFLLSTIITYII
ncbi:hypothetical protein ES703_102695 [subsurface metagenome]